MSEKELLEEYAIMLDSMIESFGKLKSIFSDVLTASIEKLSALTAANEEIERMNRAYRTHEKNYMAVVERVRGEKNKNSYMHPTDAACILEGEVNKRDWEIERLKGIIKKVQKRDHEIEQILGKALGYPAYRDDPKNFPGAKDDSVCVGDHVPVTLAMEAARRIAELERLFKLILKIRADAPCEYAHNVARQALNENADAVGNSANGTNGLGGDAK